MVDKPDTDVLNTLKLSVESKDVPAICEVLIEAFPGATLRVPGLRKIVQDIINDRGVDIPCDVHSDIDALFAKRLFDRPDLNYGGEVTVGQEYDCLEADVPYSLLAVLNKLPNWKTPSETTTAIVLSCRNEGPWLLEWIAYHRALGVRDFYIGHNDNTDGSGELIAALARLGLVTSFTNELKPTTAPQLKFYNFIANVFAGLHKHQWVFFIDADEFILPTDLDAGDSIASLSQMFGTIDADLVYFPWKWCSGNYQFSWEPGLVIDRFQHGMGDTVAKCAVRPKAIWSINHPHTAQLIDTSRSVNASGVAGQLDQRGGVDPGPAPIAGINHYFAKSFEEFALKRLKGRGDGANQEVRSLETFKWGQSDRPAEPIPAPLRSAVDQQLAWLNSLPGVAALSRGCEENARNTVELVRQQEDLADIFRSLKA